MPPTPPEERSVHGEQHHTRTVEQGSFCAARCSCGWAGPARRARERARADAARHIAR
ncbi:hypothetical protein [Streptomyces sp. NPDC048639]|uniref:hypothetical protein n=1 Tax=Streptomyces sp. NPDC048639 TaxID=3365581 RepID=UPI0037204BFA